MPVPLSYEPTLQALLSALLPSARYLLTDRNRLRRRVSWPVLARTTGIGEIEGGEIVLVPRARATEVLPRLRELTEIGVTALVVADDEAESRLPSDVPAEAPAVVAVPAATDLRRVQGEIERYIARRRRELHSLDQQLHPILVDAAIGGAGAAELLAVAAQRSHRQLLLDRDGDLLTVPVDTAPIPVEVLIQARIACREPSDTVVEIPGPPRCLALAVTAGKERRGIVLLVAVGQASPDEDDVLLTVLASACAIALAREPAIPIEPLDVVVESMMVAAAGRPPIQEEWIAGIFADDRASAAQLQRAVRAELSARDLRFLLATHRGALVALISAAGNPSWNTLAHAIAARLGSTGVRTAIGRPYPGPAGAMRTAQEAADALPHLTAPGVLFFAEIELSVLLLDTPRWQEFAHARLGPLLDDREDGGELLHTLHAYLLSGRNAKLAAHRLQVHRNTLLYRLRRAEERLGVHLDDPDTLFALELATRIVVLHGQAANAGGDTG